MSKDILEDGDDFLACFYWPEGSHAMYNYLKALRTEHLKNKNDINSFKQKFAKYGNKWSE
jgi:hypothetical protein